MNAGAVLATGIDLVENVRMRGMIERWGRKFKDRVFLPAEQEYCDGKAAPWLYYAGRFAVKEAVAKAFGTGIGPELSWLDMEVTKDDVSGAPSLRFNGKGQKLVHSRGVKQVLVSFSHTRNFAIANAILTTGENDE